MKKIIIGMMLAVLMLTGTMALAQTKDLGIVPQLVGDIVQMGDIPATVTSLSIIIYDDADQAPARQLETGATFTLLPGQGFNFQFTDVSGEYWQLITSQSVTGTGISIDCGNTGGCKYFRPVARK